MIVWSEEKIIMTDNKEGSKSGKEKFAEIRKEQEVEKKQDLDEAIKQIATRDLFETDFAQDEILVTFETKPDIKRTLRAKSPNFKEARELMQIVMDSSKYEGKFDDESISAMDKIYDELPRIAAKYSTDRELTEEWWKNTATFKAMLNFVITLILMVQTGGRGIPESQMKSFR